MSDVVGGSVVYQFLWICAAGLPDIVTSRQLPPHRKSGAMIGDGWIRGGGSRRVGSLSAILQPITIRAIPRCRLD
jgi:hypothetical protein